jgi:CheY-like chemotaxis protein
MEGKIRILVIEDEETFHTLWREILRESVPDIEYIPAYNIGEATDEFGKYGFGRDLSAIVLGACTPGSQINTLPLLRFFRAANDKVPIIATSGTPLFQEILLNAGCSHRADMPDVPKTVLAAIGRAMNFAA